MSVLYKGPGRAVVDDDIQALRTLGEKELQIFNAELGRQGKSIVAAYLLWLFFGTVGAHRFYLGKPATGAVCLALGLAIPITLALVGVVPKEVLPAAMVLFAANALSILLVLVWDLVIIPMQVARRERAIRRALIERLMSEGEST